jgi:hypothetical protein
LCTPACHFKAESEGAPSPASSNEPEAADVSEAGMLLSVALSFAEEPRRRPSLGVPADTVDELYRALARLAKEVRLRCRPVAEVGTIVRYVQDRDRDLRPIMRAVTGKEFLTREQYVRASDYDALLRTRPVSMDKLELHSLDYAIRALQMEGGYDVTVTRLTALRERLREGAK